MNNDNKLIFTEHMGRFYAKKYSFPPVVGKVMGYLLVCEPIDQSINDMAEALLTSRSAIAGAVKMLETIHAVTRTRPAGSRVDLVRIATHGWEQSGFDASEYRAQAALGREGLETLKDASPERLEALELLTTLNDFLAERMPRMLEEWNVFYDEIQRKKK